MDGRHLRAVLFFFLMIRRPPRSTLDRSSAASDVYKRQLQKEHPEMRHEIPRNAVIGVVKQDLHIIPSGSKSGSVNTDPIFKQSSTICSTDSHRTNFVCAT